jgi:hypothetical protein
MSSKKPCINNPAFSYTGNEQSPLHFGLTAEGYAVNVVMEGYDKKLYAVEVKNNKKVWIRKDDNFRVTHEEPIIKEEEPNITQNEIIPSITTTLPAIPVVEKKTTDYNLYLSWRLKQLKEENTSTNGQENKKNFSRVLEEWKLIKHKPEELKKVLEDARAYMSQKSSVNLSQSSQTKPVPATTPKKKSNTKLPSIQEENTEKEVVKKQTIKNKK